MAQGTDLIAKLKLENKEAKQAIKDLNQALALTKKELDKVNKEANKKSGKGLEGLLSSVLKLDKGGKGTSGTMGLLTGSLGKLAGAFGVALGAAELFHRTLAVNDSLGDAFNTTMDQMKSSVDSFLYALTSGQLSQWYQGLKDITSAAKEAYEAQDRFGTMKSFQSTALSNLNRDYRINLNLAKQRNLSEAERNKYLDEANQKMLLQVKLMKQQAEAAQTNAKAQLNKALGTNLIGKSEQKWIKGLLEAGDFTALEKAADKYEKKMKVLEKAQRKTRVANTYSMTTNTGTWSFEGPSPDEDKAIADYQKSLEGRRGLAAKNALNMADVSEAFKNYAQAVDEANNYTISISEMELEIANTQDKIRKAGNKLTKQLEADAKKLANLEEKKFEAVQKQAELEAKTTAEIEETAAELAIASERDASAKRVKEIEFSKKKELDALEAKKKEIIKAQVENAKALFHSDTNNEAKNFYASDEYNKALVLPKDQAESFARNIDLINKKYDAQIPILGSIADLQQKISDIQNDMVNGLVSDDLLEAKKKELLQLTRQLEDAKDKIEVNTYQKGSQNELSSRKSKLETRLADTTVASEEFKQLKAELKALTKEEYIINLKAEGLSDMQISLQKVQDKLNVFTSSWSSFSSMVGSVESVRKSVKDLADSISSGASAWQIFTSAVEVSTSILTAVEAVMTVVNMLSKIFGATQTASAVATTEQTAATTAKMGSDAASVATSTAAAVAMKTQEVAALDLAAALIFAAHAPIPFAGVPIASGAVSAMLAAMAGFQATTAGMMAFAGGGIVPGGHSGFDNRMAMVSSGEMILNSRQQKNLFALLEGGHTTGNGGKVEFIISGTNLRGVLRNDEKKTRALR